MVVHSAKKWAIKVHCWSYVHNSVVEFSGTSRKCKFYAIFSGNWWFQTKRFTGLLELIQPYKQNPLEKFFIFTIYQNYTLALSKHESLNMISSHLCTIKVNILSEGCPDCATFAPAANALTTNANAEKFTNPNPTLDQKPNHNPNPMPNLLVQGILLLQ